MLFLKQIRFLGKRVLYGDKEFRLGVWMIEDEPSLVFLEFGTNY